MPLFEINYGLLPMKLHYFLWNAGTAPIVPFVPTLAKQLGFSTLVVGTIYTFLPIFGLLAKPIFGALSDRFKIQKVLFLSFLVLTASTFYCILYIPTITNEPKVQLDCGEGQSSFKYCSEQPSDVCLRDKVIKQGNEMKTDYVCQFSCQTNNTKFLNSLCQDWRVSSFCPALSSSSVGLSSFHNGLIPTSHIISKKTDPSLSGKYNIHSSKNEKPSSLAYTSTSAVLDSSEMVDVKFRAHVNSFHITEVKTCLYFPISHVHFDYENRTTEHIPVCKVPIDISSCHVSCDNSDVMAYLASSQDQYIHVTDHYQFWLFFIFLVLSWIGMAVVVSLGDTICFELLGNEPQKYGKQRLWGAIGWGTFSIIAGFLVDHFSSGSLNKNYTPVFYLMLALLLFDLFVSSKIKNVQSSASPNIFKDVTRLLVEPRVLSFLFWCISVGICTAMIWQYLFWFLEDLAAAQGCEQNNWMKTLQGLSMTVQCFGGELPFFFISGWFLRKVGHVNSMSIVLLGFSVRFFLYSLLNDPWWSIPIELLNGVTFGLFWPCMASYANTIAPPGTEATIQGLVGAVFEGIGVSLGSFIGGFVYTTIGGRMTFRLFSGVALIFCIIHNVCHYVMRVKAKYGMDESIKDANQRIGYASPTEAIHMLEDVAS